MSDAAHAYPKRLIEVDLPIARISAHARREKSIRHGSISTLHIWWARRPLAACRAVICASLWPDPADGLCPPKFREDAFRILEDLRRQVIEGGISPDQRAAYEPVSRMMVPKGGDDLLGLRRSLLHFIAEFASLDLSTNTFFLQAGRALTQSAHESLGGEPGSRPLLVDPFAGGGAIPLEALRVGADAFASDLNPVAVLLNKVVLEYIPKYGQKLADEVRKWGQWVKEQAEKELAQFYPKDPDGSTPIAYLWARTIQCEGPGCGAEVPLMRSLWLAKKGSRSVALRLVPKPEQKIVDFEIIKDAKARDVGEGTVRRGSATCPVCGYTTPVASVRVQMKARKGGAHDARLFAVVTTRPTEQGRFYRLPTEADLKAIRAAEAELENRKSTWAGELSLVPDELTPRGGGSGAGRAFSQRHYGMEQFCDLFTPRQLLSLTTLGRWVREAGQSLSKEYDVALADAVQSILACAVDRGAEHLSSLCRWNSSGQKMQASFGRQAISMMWDFCEADPFGGSVGSWESLMECVLIPFETCLHLDHTGNAERASATVHPLPDDSAAGFITDPPYYDAIPYSDLSDFFYVWMRRNLPDQARRPFMESLAPKTDECIVDEVKGKDKAYFEKTMALAMTEGRRVLHPKGIGLVVFAHKSTSGWEAQLQAMVDAGWTMTASWPIDTEMGTRLRAMDSAALASSVHLVCRPRENADGAVRIDEIGDWRDVLSELPSRIHEWMPRLASEGVVGADAIFACLGPALEIFSRYSRVEKSNGDVVMLREYLEHVWAAVSHEALSMIFKDADASGLEPDARLTAMWLWTLGASSTASGNGNGYPSPAEDEVEDEDAEDEAKPVNASGFVLEFDAARKIAQGLGIHLEKIPSVIEVKGDKARLLPVAERTRYLFGKDSAEPATGKKKPKKKDTQLTLFAALQEVDAAESVEKPELKAPQPGSTVLDRVHQAMILFAAGRGEALRRFLVEEGIGKDGRFWKLAQSLSALYPAGIDEKRWVDGVLARKKSLGL